MLGRRGVRAYAGHIRSTRLSRAYPSLQVRKVLGPCPDDRTFPCVEDFPTAAPVTDPAPSGRGCLPLERESPGGFRTALSAPCSEGGCLILRLASKSHGCSGGRSYSSWAGIPPRGAEKPQGGPRTALSAPCGKGEVCPCVWPASPTAAPVAGPAPLGRGMLPPEQKSPRAAPGRPQDGPECASQRG